MAPKCGSLRSLPGEKSGGAGACKKMGNRDWKESGRGPEVVAAGPAHARP